MSNFYTKLYILIPDTIKRRLGKSQLLKPIRDIILRPRGKFKQIMVHIDRKYLLYDVNFKFIASLKTATTAKSKGIENTILNNSINLLDSIKSHNNDCVVLDVGSNFGYLSLVWANSVCQNGTVHAFESNPEVCDALMKSVVENKLRQNVCVNSDAVGNENGMVKMYFTDTYSNIKNLYDTNKHSLVNMVSLDTYMDSLKLTGCDLIKIDVDGSELDVLEGGIRLLNKFKPIFVVETNNEIQVVNFFLKNNYKVLNMNLTTFTKNDSIPMNIFCIPN